MHDYSAKAANLNDSQYFEYYWQHLEMCSSVLSTNCVLTDIDFWCQSLMGFYINHLVT